MCKYMCDSANTHTHTYGNTHMDIYTCTLWQPPSMYVEVRRHITGLDFLLASCRLQGSNSGHQTCSRQLLSPPHHQVCPERGLC